MGAALVRPRGRQHPVKLRSSWSLRLPIYGRMDGINVQGLRAELALLEAQETLVSAKRRHLHNQIDLGYGGDEARTREREISAERQQLHRRIYELRELLGPSPPT